MFFPFVCMHGFSPGIWLPPTVQKNICKYTCIYPNIYMHMMLHLPIKDIFFLSVFHSIPVKCKQLKIWISPFHSWKWSSAVNKRIKFYCSFIIKKTKWNHVPRQRNTAVLLMRGASRSSVSSTTSWTRHIIILSMWHREKTSSLYDKMQQQKNSDSFQMQHAVVHPLFM